MNCNFFFYVNLQKKIDKRGRKLVDYDGQRHNFQALQTNMAKKRDEQKISKGRELLEEAKRTYEMLNSELHDELPALHDSRILFLVTNLQTLFSAEQVFHAETTKVSNHSRPRRRRRKKLTDHFNRTLRFVVHINIYIFFSIIIIIIIYN